MKAKIIFLFCMIISVIAFGQNEKHKSLKEIEVTPPKFTGIERAASILEEENVKPIADYLSKNVKYPEEAAKRWFEGTVVVEFVVSATGEVTDFKVINSVSTEIDEELIQVLKTTSGMWNPGSNNGEPVAMQKEVSMVFKIDESKSFATQSKAFFKNGSEMFLVTGKLKRALKSYDKGIKLLPNDKSLLFMRGLCRYELGDEQGARQDWNRMAALDETFIATEYLTADLYELKGYAELKSMLAQKE